MNEGETKVGRGGQLAVTVSAARAFEAQQTHFFQPDHCFISLALFLPLSSSFGLHLDVQLFFAALLSSLTVLCVLHAVDGQRRPLCHSTMRAAAMPCSLPSAEATESVR